MNAPTLPWLAEPLRRCVETGRGHAVLLYGPPGVGQFELALALAAAWLCEADVAARPCGACPACRLVQARSHPDLLVVVPAALREALGWQGADEGEDKPGRAKPSRDILVGDVRSLVAFSQTTPARGGAKVAVLHPAERMNPIAANTLLKTLEEPPGALRFVLATAAADRLLPTVRSRCQAIALPVPDARLAAEWLDGQGLTDPRRLLAAAGGQPLDAVAAATDGLDAALIQRLPDLVRAGDASALARLPLPRLVVTLQKLCHDLQRVAAGSTPRYFQGLVAPQPMPDGRDLSEWARDLAAAARHAEHPWNAGLAAEALIFRARRALAAPTGAPR